MRQRRSEPPLVAAARRAGVDDVRVLDALAAVPRERFVPASQRRFAQEDRPIRTSRDQTTSQPSLIALMVAALGLTGGERVLEIGTGPGYQAAILSHLAAKVYSVERHPELAQQARDNLAGAGIDNVWVRAGDGTRGWPDRAPFGAIIIAAATAEVPGELVHQLVHGGRVVAPIHRGPVQQVVVQVRTAAGLEVADRLIGVRFVPLVAGPSDDGSPPDDGEPGG